jgi:hypothetical protein
MKKVKNKPEKFKKYKPSKFLIGDFYMTNQERNVYRFFGRLFKKLMRKK